MSAEGAFSMPAGTSPEACLLVGWKGPACRSGAVLLREVVLRSAEGALSMPGGMSPEAWRLVVKKDPAFTSVEGCLSMLARRGPEVCLAVPAEYRALVCIDCHRCNCNFLNLLVGDLSLRPGHGAQ